MSSVDPKERVRVAIQKFNPVENAVVGIGAGLIEVTILQPLLYWKNATQQRLPFTLNPRIVYRGLLMSQTNMAVLTGLQFPLTGVVTSLITGGERRRLASSEMVTAGFLGGALSGLACGPMELVMIQQQRFGGNILSTPLRIASHFGVLGRGIFRGLLSSSVREGCFTGTYLVEPCLFR